MKKKLFKITSTFIIIASLFCGCTTTDKSVKTNNTQEVTQKERASEYRENDKPWGDYNYKKIGVIKELKKNLDDNITTGMFTVDGENTEDKLKIYGTDMNISDYEGKKVFVSAVKKNDVDEGNVLVKRYEDINLEGLELLDSIKNLNSIDNSKELNNVKSRIDSLKNKGYKNYVMASYNSKISELTENKTKEDEQRKINEAQTEKNRKDGEKQKQQQEAQSKQAQENSNSNNQQNQNVQTKGENVYIASSGKGKCYHSNPNCSRMNGNVNSMSRAEAEQIGYRACKKCY